MSEQENASGAQVPCISLLDALRRALAQWRMYADEGEPRNLRAEDSAEGALYRDCEGALKQAESNSTNHVTSTTA